MAAAAPGAARRHRRRRHPTHTDHGHVFVLDVAMGGGREKGETASATPGTFLPSPAALRRASRASPQIETSPWTGETCGEFVREGCSPRGQMPRNSQWIATQRESVWRENRCVGLIAGWGSGLVGYKFRHFSFYHFTARGSTSCMSAQRRTYVRSRGRCPVSAVDRPPSLSHSRSHSPPCTRLPPCSLLAARVRVAGPALSVSPHARTAIRTNKIVCAVALPLA
jgi:hypothetical protein